MKAMEEKIKSLRLKISELSGELAEKKAKLSRLDFLNDSSIPNEGQRNLTRIIKALEAKIKYYKDDLDYDIRRS